MLIYIIFSILVIGFTFSLWYFSKDYKEEQMLEMEIVENNYKKLIVRNKTNQKLYLETTFEYSEEEIKTLRLNILNYYNGKGGCVIDAQKENFVILPIRKKECVRFPHNFSVILKDSLNTVIYEYDEKLFLESAIVEPKNIRPKINAVTWTLDVAKTFKQKNTN